MNGDGYLGRMQAIDRQFARLMVRLAGESASDALRLAAACVSHTTTSRNHVCFDLRAAAGRTAQEVFDDWPVSAEMRMPELATWRAALRATPVVGRPGQDRPLVLDEGDRLYLLRFWHYEQEVARAIRARASRARAVVADPSLFGRLAGAAGPLQRAAAVAAVRRLFCLVTGGPGTGKTYTAAIIIALLRSVDTGHRVRLCAPTGKAAVRMGQALAKLQAEGILPADVDAEPTTIHRLLGSIGRGAGSGKTLALDTVIVDEASMISVELMAALVRAVPADAGLIMLGDHDQLASVEAGAVLGDICAAAAPERCSDQFRQCYMQWAGTTCDLPLECGKAGVLDDCVVRLHGGRRFESGGAIDTLAGLIRCGRADTAREVLEDRTIAAVELRSLPDADGVGTALEPFVDDHIVPMLQADTPAAALAALSRFRILSPLRAGPWGVAALNQTVQAILRERGLLPPTSEAWYAGQPIMITRNDYLLEVYNGDVGIVWPDAQGQLRFWLRGRSLAPALLPPHETVYAMTVHKAQGDEYAHVLLVLPERTAVLGRELLYTAVTRAQQRVTLWADAHVLQAAIAHRVLRPSGLCAALSSQL